MARTATRKPKQTAAKSTSSKASASTPVVEATSAPSPDVVVAQVAEPVNEVVQASSDSAATQEPSIGDVFGDLLNQLTALRGHITALSSQVRVLRARSERELRAAQKVSKKRKNPNRKPSGFVKPTLISTELASFLGKPKGTEMARTEVTKEINQYVRDNNLKDPENGRRILADGKLRKLLNLGKGDELTYFNLQRYIKHHFAKAGETA